MLKSNKKGKFSSLPPDLEVKCIYDFSQDLVIGEKEKEKEYIQ